MEDEKAMKKIMEMMRLVAIFLTILNVYYFCYGFFKALGAGGETVERIIGQFGASSGLFNANWITKTGAAVFLLLSCLGTKGKPTAEMTWGRISFYGIAGLLVFFGSQFVLQFDLPAIFTASLYSGLVVVGFLLLLRAGNWISRMLSFNLLSDVFNKANESFPQEERKMDNEYSVNLQTSYTLRGKDRKGWINVVNPFRATGVLGTPGSGKSYAIINEFIRQHLAKGYTMYIYDYKFDDLSVIAYNALIKNQDKFQNPVGFYVINFDNPHKSHRCNPLLPSMMTDIVDAYESAYTIMLNLNKSWIQKQGDFFVESPINFLTAIIWFLKLYEKGKYCTFPHVIEFLNLEYDQMFPVLGAYSEIENYVRPFISAYQGEAMEQLEGQIASARIPLSRLASPQLYWVMSGNDFTLDINNPKEPKVLCVGNNPDRQAIYGAALGLYNARLVKLINKKGRLKSSLIIDELPTIYFKGLDNLIATARSNKVSTCLGFQDFSQLERDYGKQEAMVIRNTIGNLFAGQVTGDSAESLSKRFGRVLQQRQSLSINSRDTSTSISTQLDSMIPASTISNLTQGNFVGAVADNFGEEIEQKIFHAKILVDVKKIELEAKNYQPIPNITSFVDESGVDRTEEILRGNYDQIKADVKRISELELARIGRDPQLCHLIKAKE